MRSVAPIDAPMNTFARINLLDRLPALVAVDLEVCPQTSRIRAIGAVRTGKDPPLSWKGDNPRLGRRAAGALSRRRGAGRGGTISAGSISPISRRRRPGSWPGVLCSHNRQPVAIALAWPEPRTLRLKKIKIPAEGLLGAVHPNDPVARCAGRHGADGRGALDAHRDLARTPTLPMRSMGSLRDSRGVVKWCGLSPFCAIAPHPAMARATPPSRGLVRGRICAVPHRPNPATGPRRRRLAAVPADTDRLGPAGRGGSRPGCGTGFRWRRTRSRRCAAGCAAIRGCAWCAAAATAGRRSGAGFRHDAFRPRAHHRRRQTDAGGHRRCG